MFSHFYFIFNKNNISFMIRFPKSRDSYFICCSFLFMFSMFIEMVINEDWGCSTSTHKMIDFMFVLWRIHLSAKYWKMISMPLWQTKEEMKMIKSKYVCEMRTANDVGLFKWIGINRSGLFSINLLYSISLFYWDWFIKVKVLPLSTKS